MLVAPRISEYFLKFKNLEILEIWTILEHWKILEQLENLEKFLKFDKFRFFFWKFRKFWKIGNFLENFGKIGYFWKFWKFEKFWKIWTILEKFGKIWKIQKILENLENFGKLGPGRPSAGGPRMDRQAVTNLGVVKISCLASRLRRSVWQGTWSNISSVWENELQNLPQPVH